MQVQSGDIEVIQSVLGGNQSAYSILVERYQRYVFTLTLRYTNDREVAEELAQDVFVKAYRYLADFKGKSKFSTWLYTIVHTTCVSHIRKKNVEHLAMDEERMIGIADRMFSENPVQALDQKASKLLLSEAMGRLPGEDQRLLTLYYMGEQSIEEIGAIMGWTASNVKIRLFRARGKLKEILETKFSGEFTR